MNNENLTADLREILRPYWQRNAPSTNYLMLIVIVVFTIQLIIAELIDSPNVQYMMPYFFEHYPAIWLIAAFLHRGVGHLFRNLVFLALLRPVEHHLSKDSYFLLVLLGGVLSTWFGGRYLVIFGAKAQSAFYGLSGFNYGLGGFALLNAISPIKDREYVDLLTATIGIYFVYTLGVELVAAFSSPLALNPGHLFGFLAGILLWMMIRLSRFKTRFAKVSNTK